MYLFVILIALLKNDFIHVNSLFDFLYIYIYLFSLFISLRSYPILEASQGGAGRRAIGSRDVEDQVAAEPVAYP